jgi:hypothetical protein
MGTGAAVVNARSPMLRQKVYHRASLVNENGDMSALCFKSPRAIDLSKATWTIRDDAVTCPKCRAAIRRKAKAA